jgi:Mg/Co/Ni transporter MgtE
MKDIDNNKDDIVPGDKDIREAIGEALESADGVQLTEIMDSIPSQDALRHVSHLDTEERDQVVSLIIQRPSSDSVDYIEKQRSERCIALRKSLLQTVG